MSSIFESLQGVLSSDFANKAASSLGVDSGKVSSALTSMVPGLLGSLLSHKSPNDLEASVKEAATVDPSSEQATAIGGNFINSLLGDNKEGFIGQIASSAGLSNGIVGKLLGMVAPVVASYLGKQVNSGTPISQLLGQLGDEKSKFSDLIPAGIGQLLQSGKLPDLGGLGGSLGDLGKKFGF